MGAGAPGEINLFQPIHEPVYGEESGAEPTGRNKRFRVEGECEVRSAFVVIVLPSKWGCGAAGSAPAWHAGGQGFKSPQLHQ